MKFSLPTNVQVDNSPDEARGILNLVITSDVNDYYIGLGQKPFIRRQGFFSEVSSAPIIDPAKMDSILKFLLKERENGNEDAKESLANRQAFHFSGTLSSGLDGIERECRYRAILVNTLNGPELTVRVLDRNLLSLESLGFQHAHHDKLVSMLKKGKGLILISGPTGAGKSTTLAAIIQHLINEYPYHVVTLEDPVEFIFKPQLQDKAAAYSMVSQRSVGVDVPTYQHGLLDALRQKPDVIAIGEIRDAETMRTVIQAAETGHLIIGTMHASTVYQAIDRIVTQAGPDGRIVRQMLANNLLCIIAQNLLPAADSTEENPKRVLCYEALFRTPDLSRQLFNADQIKTSALADMITGGEGITWNACLEKLIEEGHIHQEDGEALKTLET
jgi:twitching motility protein PilT